MVAVALGAAALGSVTGTPGAGLGLAWRAATEAESGPGIAEDEAGLLVPAGEAAPGGNTEAVDCASGGAAGAQGGLLWAVAELLPFGLKKKRLGVGHQLAAAVGQQWQPGFGQGEGLPLGMAFAVLAKPPAASLHMVADGGDAKAADTLQQPHMSKHLVCCRAEEQQQLPGQLQRLAAMDATSAVAALLLLGLAPGAASAAAAAAAAVMHKEAAAAAEAVVVVAAAAAAEMAADAVTEPAVRAAEEGAGCQWISDCRGAVLGLYQS